ncbi:wall-associated receptor kinase 2-like [Carex rostrata]
MITVLSMVVHHLLLFWIPNHQRDGKDIIRKPLSSSIFESFLLVTSPISSAQLNCNSSCGDLTIPYPFGIGTGCFRDGFEITCQISNTTTNKQYTATLAGTTIPVLNLSLEVAEVQVQLPIGWQFYNKSGVEASYSAEVNFNPKSIYRISNTHNLLVVIGCNTLGYIESQRDRNGVYSYDYYTGCVSFCNNSNSIIDGSCSGVGCCQVTIPSGLSDNLITFSDYSHTGLLSFSRCDYSFLVDKDWFKFGKLNLTMSTNTSVPMWLNWAIRDNNNCTEAQKRPESYGCRSTNSECYDSVNGPGYLCKCLEGYQGISAGTVILFVILSVIFMYQKRKIQRELQGRDTFVKELQSERETLFKRNEGLILYEQLAKRKVETMNFFTEEELETITENFAMVIGHGGQGMVYKGCLEDNREVAVKKCIVDNEMIKEGFINELVILSQINHNNIVRLLGCCLQRDVPMLVYEYIPYGTLSSFLHEKQSDISLEIRLQICTHSAKALAHLHSETVQQILHGDVKSTNILLGDKCMAKVSDFGISRFLPKDKTQVTNNPKGTFGYVDPEFVESGRLTPKSDVYSFGVVIIELFTRKEARYKDGDNELKLSLADQFRLTTRQNNAVAMFDPKIATEENQKLLVKVAKIAEKCLRLTGEERPTMAKVAEDLKGLETELEAMRDETCDDS